MEFAHKQLIKRMSNEVMKKNIIGISLGYKNVVQIGYRQKICSEV